MSIHFVEFFISGLNVSISRSKDGTIKEVVDRWRIELYVINAFIDFIDKFIFVVRYDQVGKFCREGR